MFSPKPFSHIPEMGTPSQPVSAETTESEHHFTAKEIAERWKCVPTTVLRVFRRFGSSGIKYGTSKHAMRRFPEGEVQRIESLCGKGPNSGTTAGSEGWVYEKSLIENISSREGRILIRPLNNKQ